MSKLILTTPASFVNDASAVAQETVNNAAIMTALENTLSRDGTTPNQMIAPLDMNSQRILNLPTPVSGLEPVRLVDVSTAPGLAGALAKLNNLSDLTSVPVAKANLALDQVDNTSDAAKNAAVATLTNKTLTTPVINSPTGIVKANVGLGNVDNTSDVNKPVSTAQAAANALKADIASPTLTGTVSFTGGATFNSAGTLNWKDSGATVRSVLFQFSDDHVYLDNQTPAKNIILRTGGFTPQAVVSPTGVQLLNVPTAPTATAGTNTAQLATTAFVQANAGGLGGNTFQQADRLSGSFLTLSSGVITDIVSFSLPAGKWLVWGNVVFAAQGTTAYSETHVSISTTSATLDPSPGSANAEHVAYLTGQSAIKPTAPKHLVLGSTTTVYLTCTHTLTGGSPMLAYGSIFALPVAA